MRAGKNNYIIDNMDSVLSRCKDNLLSTNHSLTLDNSVLSCVSRSFKFSLVSIGLFPYCLHISEKVTDLISTIAGCHMLHSLVLI